MKNVAPLDLLGEFVEHDRELQLRGSRLGHALIIALMPLGVTLDWFMYRALLPELLALRLLVSALAAVAWGLHSTNWARRNIRLALNRASRSRQLAPTAQNRQ